MRFTGIRHYDDNNPRDYSMRELGRPPDLDEDAEFYRDLGADLIATRWARCGYRFWPLVTEILRKDVR